MRLTRTYTLIFSCLAIGYLLAIYLIPPDASVLTKYNLSVGQVRALSTGVALPLVAIWATALVGLQRITRYAYKIRKHPEGKGFALIARGLAVLVMGLPLTTLNSTILNYVARENPSFTPASIIIINYVSLLVVLIGFYIISKGTHMLLQRTGKTTTSSPVALRIVLVFFSILFVYLTFSNPSRTHVVEGVQKAVYYLPDWLIATTIVIPYILAWYLGLLAAYQLNMYGKQIAGVIYKKGFSYISLGLVSVIFASILFRFLSRLNFFFNGIQLRALLIILYLLLVVISVGYILIAVGAKKLNRIEEV